MRLLPLLLLGLAVLPAARPVLADEGTKATPKQVAALLETLVDLPTPKQRAKLASELAMRKDIPLRLWLAAMRGFGTFQKQAPGASTQEVMLSVGDERVAQLFTAYVPKGYDPAVPSPMLVAFHGSGGDGRTDWRPWQGVADAMKMIVFCPGDAIAAQGYTAGAKERDTAWAAIRLARRTFNVDENRIFATGISRGGHLVWDMALRQPDRFAAIAPMIGAPRLSPSGGQNTLRYLENLARTPIRDLQGSKDDPRMLHNLRYAFKKLKGFGAIDAELIEYAQLGHTFDFTSVDWKAWLGTCRRSPTPATVVRRFAKPGEGRAYFIEVLKAGSKIKEIPQLKVGAKWSRMSEKAQREFLADYLEARTARIEVTQKGKGVFHMRPKEVTRARLFLTREMLGEDGKIEVKWGNRRIRKTVTTDLRVLLTEFAERFDRTFLPVAAVSLP